MYYDTYRGKKRGRKPSSSGCLGWLLGAMFKLLALALAAMLIAGAALYALPVALMNIEPAGVDLSITDGLSSGQVNVLLLGLDYMDEGQQRSDAMIVASVSYSGVKLTSLMRDTLVEIPGHGQHKLNSAYSYGGAEMAMRVVNQTFGLNITNYAAVDLRTLVDLIDALGGVTVSIEEAEIEHINSCAWNTYKKISQLDSTRYLHYADSQPITAAGEYELNGLFATAYTRIRHADSDYMRTARQREVISGMIEKLRKNFYRPQIYVQLYEVFKNSVDTNLSLVELISMGEKILVSGNIETHRAPANAYIHDDGSSITIQDPSGNIEDVRAFIYG